MTILARSMIFLIFSKMPKGVEHLSRRVQKKNFYDLIFSKMPKGVEHILRRDFAPPPFY